MAKRTVSASKNKKPKITRKAAIARRPVAKARPSKASTSKKAAAKNAARTKVIEAARVKAIEAARVAEATAATTLNYAPAPFESVADHDPSKASGKHHRHPPASLVGMPHSSGTIVKAQSFSRRKNLGR